MSAQTPRTIAFEDIRKGDRIRAECVENGVTYTREGVAHEQVTGTWWAEGGGIIVDLAWLRKNNATITLVNRPKATEPTGAGAIIRARLKGFEAGAQIYVRTASPEWDKGHPAPWTSSASVIYGWDEFDPDSIEVISNGVNL